MISGDTVIEGIITGVEILDLLVSISATPSPLLGQLGVVPDEQEEEDQDDHLLHRERDYVTVASIHSDLMRRNKFRSRFIYPSNESHKHPENPSISPRN